PPGRGRGGQPPLPRLPGPPGAPGGARAPRADRAALALVPRRRPHLLPRPPAGGRALARGPGPFAARAEGPRRLRLGGRVAPRDEPRRPGLPLRAGRRAVRYAVLADVHANLPALDAVLSAASAAGAARVVCAGDLVGYHADPEACVRRLREAGAICVAG